MSNAHMRISSQYYQRRSSLQHYLAFGAIFLLAVVALMAVQQFFPKQSALQARAVQKPKSSDMNFDGGVAWLNTEKPIKLKDLRGRVVLLDFWTLCCINCIHTLPDLAKLEAKYPGVLVVIGVHSPKFPNEKKTESIRKAVLRYEIKHPVVNDANMDIWDRFRPYGVSGWPSLVLINPDGKYYGITSGEGNFELLDFHIGKLVKEFQAKGTLKKKPLPFQLARRKEPPGSSPLYFPGKILADLQSNRLFIADSTHHRIVITDLKGKKIAIAGSGKEGAKDGPFAKATFSDPQGMALVGNTLYVADRKNHMLRALDLKNKTVKRVAGTGKQNHNRTLGGPSMSTGLNSPWDLLKHQGKLFIAMAGTHQIWTFDPKRQRVEPYAGSGREDLVDGPLDASAFAQPSGLTTDGKLLYVADSEISAIRSLPLDASGSVKTIVGEGLFVFGDEDGKGSKVRLQHALGVIHHKGKLYVADTYNSKLKIIDPEQRTCKTVALKQSKSDKGPLLNEPGGLSIVGNELFIADTNSHRIRRVDLDNLTISTLELQGVEPPQIAKKK